MKNSQFISLIGHILEKEQQKKKTRPGGYPPAEQLHATEKALGFALPPLFRMCYLQVGNGGFGPGEGVMGILSGFEDN